MDPANKHLDLLLSDMARSPALYVWISILVVSIALGAYALLMSLVFSLEIFEFSIKIPWGMMVSNYVFLVGSSTGLCIVASLGYVFGLQRYQLIGKRSLFLALIAIIFGLCSIGLHLGHPERGMIYNLLTPNFRSAMWWMTTLYPFYIACIAAWFWFLARGELVEIAGMSAGLKARIYRLLLLNRMEVSEDSANRDLRWATVFGALALLFGLLAYSVEGTLFAHTEARPFWYGALYSIDFFLGASFCGFAWLLAAVTVTYKIRRDEIPEKLSDLFHEMAQILVLLLSVDVLFVAYKMGHGLFEPAKAKTIMLFLNGPFSLAFWLFEIVIGLVLPILVLLYATSRRKMTGVTTASVMVLVGYFVKRYNFVVASQVYPVIEDGLPSYLPAFMEVLLISGILGGFFLSYTLGEKFLPLKDGLKRGTPL